MLLIARHVTDGKAGELALLLQRDRFSGFLGSRIAHQRLLALLPVQGLKYFVGALGLIPVDIVGMVGLLFESGACLMAIEDRAAESRSLHRIAIAARGAVAAREDEFERAGAGLAE